MVARAHTFYAENLIPALREEGIPTSQIWELQGWRTNEAGYYWTNVFTGRHNGYDGISNGHLNHHTASSAYTPYVQNSSGQCKCNTWGGLRRGDRLYQAGGGIPTLAIASAGPANYSAGSGVKSYVEALARGEKRGKQTASDDSPKWYGNRYVWNTEWILNGTGAEMDPDMWDLLVAYNTALARLHDQPEGWNGFHAGLTKRKVDFWDGTFDNAQATTEAIWDAVAPRLGLAPLPPGEIMGCPWTNTTDRDAPWYDGKRDEHGNARPPCTNHYDLDRELVWGVNTGMCNVPEQQYGPIKEADGVIWSSADGGRDIYTETMEYGRTVVLINRALG